MKINCMLASVFLVGGKGDVKSMPRQAGLGLVEIMVAMAVGVFMLGGVLALVIWVSQARVELDKTSEQIENGRYAIQLLSDELRLAGFFGASQVGGADSSLPPVCPSAVDQLGFGYDSTTMITTLPVAVQGLSQANASCFTNASTSSEAVVIRRVETKSVASAADDVLYVQMSACQSDAFPMLFGVKGSPVFNLKDKDCSGGAEFWPYTLRAFYLSSCDICSPSDGIPTLKMAELKNSASGVEVVEQSMVEGVEDIHFEYGLDLNADGAPDCYVPDPSLDSPPTWASCPATGWSAVDAKNWSSVVSVRVNLLARSTEPSPGWSEKEKARKYDLGRKDSTGAVDLDGPFNDNYRRQVYSAVVTLPNVSGVRE